MAFKGTSIYEKGVALRWKAYLEKLDGRPPEKVFKLLEQSLELFEETGHQLQIAETKIRMARHHLAAGQAEKARDLARQAADVYAPYLELTFPGDLKPLIEDFISDSNLLDEVLQMGLDMVTIRNDRKLVQHIVSTINRITGAERGAIFFFDPKKSPPEFALRSAKI